MPLNKYAPQVATHRRTQTAILQATKELISSVGIKKMSMIEIADTSQVSRATLYNHYRDKESVLKALCEAEISGLVSLAQAAETSTDALEQMSLYVSSDTALAAMRKNDPELLSLVLSAQDDLLWQGFAIAISHLLPQSPNSQLAIRWLIGQALFPITAEQSRKQAELITGFANI